MNCEHKGCRCNEADVEQAGKRFCSEHCAEKERAGTKESSCHCGHPDCAA
jgi:hypothetical protein